MSYNIVVLGSGNVGKKSLIKSAQSLFQKMIQEQDQADRENNDGPSSPTTSGGRKRSSFGKRLSVSGRRLSVKLFGSSSPKNEIHSSTFEALLSSVNNNASATSNNRNSGGNSHPQFSPSMSELLGIGEQQQESVFTVIVPSSTSNSSSSPHRISLNVTCIHNTGFTFNEQEAVGRADGFLILVDLSNRFSMERAKFFHKKITQLQMLYYKRYVLDPSIEKNEQAMAAFLKNFKVPLVLVGTKSDLTEKRQLQIVDCLKLTDSWNGCPFIEVSSTQMNSKGVESVFRELLSQISVTDKKRKSLGNNISSAGEFFLSNF